MSQRSDADHARLMAKHKAAVDARKAKAQEDRGVLVVHTGNGKGKSSAAFGLVARALGHGMRVGIVQFIKGKFMTGEAEFFRDQPGVDFYCMGEGFTWETQDRQRDLQAAEAAWQRAEALLSDPALGLVVLDELNTTIKRDYLDLERILEALSERPSHQHVVITGRGARQRLIDAADTVSEAREIKHAFKAGVKAQQGVEL